MIHIIIQVSVICYIIYHVLTESPRFYYKAVKDSKFCLFHKIVR